MSEDSTKDLIREELQKLSKDDLINIVAELVNALYEMIIKLKEEGVI